MQKLSRRDLARWIAAAGAVAISSSEIVAQPPSGPVRKDISSLAPDAPDLVNYRKVVGLMQKLSASDRRCWKKQWDTHTDFCPHGNWWFLPWHRAYLHYF